ncbi:MAG: sodium:proline symporter [Spirochaetes bacterium]|nr:sodium:proline symporter [Spirochaetota bacterium]MBU1081405.1 sodium:proline symporter [Spirochaetota bacterium]
MSGGAKVLIIGFSFAMIVVSFLIGIWAKRKADTAQAFFGGTALFGPFVVGLSTMSAVASAFAIVGIPGIIYATGNPMSFWMLSSAAFGMAYIILGKKVRAMAELGPISSLGDISDLRFQKSRYIKAVMSLVLFLGCIAYLAAQIKGVSVMFAHLLGWNFYVTGFLIFGVLIAYMIIGGEAGGIMTQAFQGLVMAVAGIIIIIGFFVVTGGFGNVLDAVAKAGAITGGGVTKKMSADFLNAWGILPGQVSMVYMLIPILGTVGQPQVLTRMYALKNPRDMPKLGLWAALSHAIVGFLAIVMGFGALYLVATGKIAPLAKADTAAAVFADSLGIWGQLLFYATVLAAAMSSASMFLSLSAGIISRDLPAAIGMKAVDGKTQIKRFRITMGVLGVIAVALALTNDSMVAILGTFGWGTLMSATFPVFVVGLLWKRASKEGVAVGISLALVLNVICFILVQNKFKFPGGIPWYFNVIVVSIAATILVSLFTSGASGKNLDRAVEKVLDL